MKRLCIVNSFDTPEPSPSFNLSRMSRTNNNAHHLALAHTVTETVRTSSPYIHLSSKTQSCQTTSHKYWTATTRIRQMLSNWMVVVLTFEQMVHRRTATVMSWMVKWPAANFLLAYIEKCGSHTTFAQLQPSGYARGHQVHFW